MLELPLVGGVRIDLDVLRASTTPMAPPTRAPVGGHWVDTGLVRGLVVPDAASAETLLRPLPTTNSTGEEEQQ